MATVVVVGGGIGGLASAVRLAHLGYRVTLIEPARTPGRAYQRDSTRRVPLRHRSHPADDAGSAGEAVSRPATEAGRLPATRAVEPILSGLLRRRLAVRFFALHREHGARNRHQNISPRSARLPFSDGRPLPDAGRCGSRLCAAQLSFGP
ncbi:MAG: FAD-dependent oxidoreductase [Chthonomonadetes bacterium]|nr:FAD-dependent oxidoreductase [Chthonomonadetes bacterium]